MSNSDSKQDLNFPEAPASWNTRYQTPEGFVCQVTLRAESGKDLLEKANAAISFLLKLGYSPCGDNNKGDGKVCSIHQVWMKRREKDGQVFYSHKCEDGSWCHGKEKKNGGKS